MRRQPGAASQSDNERPRDMPAGPCIICGDTNYGLSMGGPSVCPPCDCGRPPGVGKLQREVQSQGKRIIDLYCALDVALGLPSATPEMRSIGERVCEDYRRSHPGAARTA